MVGRGKMTLNQNCKKFNEMDKSIKKNYFHCLADGRGCKNELEPKLQEI